MSDTTGLALAVWTWIGTILFLSTFVSRVRAVRRATNPLTGRSMREAWLDPDFPIALAVIVFVGAAILLWPIRIVRALRANVRLIPRFMRMLMHVRNGGRPPGTRRPLPPGFR